MASSPAAPPALLEATRNSTIAWQDNLQALFDDAKGRFPDVVWELHADEDAQSSGVEEVWGHKAIVYARAPPSFQARYFQFRPPPISSPVPYSSSPTGTLPAQSALSLTLGIDFSGISRSPSPFRAVSPSPSTRDGAVLRLPTSINPTLFSKELEYLYTGKGFGAAFEFLFDTSESREEGDAEEARIDKLRKDLVFMWRSRLYSDIRIALTGNFSTSNHDSTTAVFSSHRFILVSRSPYFRTQLLQWGVKSTPGEPLTLTLPSPPFTPASLHFTLGFIYTGTLVFSHRTFDLDTGFHIMRSAAYLSLDSLYDEIQARIVQEMMHGLFHAFLEFSEYEAITGGRWGTGGCKCRQCARRAPRVLEFALMDDVKNTHLERGARRALVGLFGEGWCNAEFARLPQKVRDSILKGLSKRTTPLNVFALLFAAEVGLAKIKDSIEPWASVPRDMILSARKSIDDVLCTQADQCFEQPDWLAIMEVDGVRFEDGEKVEVVMEAVRRGMSERNAASLYQTLVSSILLRPHATEAQEAMLSPTSHVRVQVEQTRMDVLRWLRRRWINVKQESGFDHLESWALKEISHEIEVPVEDLLNPVPVITTVTPSRHGPRPHGPKIEEDSASMHSVRTPTLHRNIPKHAGETMKSSGTSIRSVAKSTRSTASRTSVATTTRRTVNTRPDSKLTPGPSFRTSTASTRSTLMEKDGNTSPTPPPKSPIVARRNVMSSATNSDGSHGRSSAASFKSARSTATVRKTMVGSSSLRPTSSLSRPASTMSTTSDGSTNFETAKSDATPSNGPRSRRVSAVSTVSKSSVKTTVTTATSPSPKVPRSRVASTASKISVNGKQSSSSSPNTDRLAPVQAKRTASTTSTASTASIHSMASSASNMASKKSSTRKSTVSTVSTASTASTNPPTPPPKNDVPRSPTISRNGTVQGKTMVMPVHVAAISHEKQSSIVSSGSASTVRGSLKRKNSADTITESNATEPPVQSGVPRGATLEIGIPCIITSKRARFRAYARYIGEVEGEEGPWVGVEVPVSEDWAEDKLEGRQWNDGTWGGIRYFDIGIASEWEFGEDRGSRRRRVDWSSSHSSLKREGDQLSIDRAKRLRSASPAISDVSNSESRGLFVRPQQVLYVVDAVP